MDKSEYDIYNQLSGLFCNIQKGPGATVLKELYDFLKKFPKVAPFNLALVSAQRPGAGYFTDIYSADILEPLIPTNGRSEPR